MRCARLSMILIAFSIASVVLVSGCVSSAQIQNVSEREARKVEQNLDGPLELYIHGAGDSSESWGRRFEREFGGIAIDWSEISESRLDAARAGYLFGESLGLALSASLSGRPVSVIAHSAGAWVAQGLVDALLADGVDTESSVSMVLLDPFTAKSLVQLWAGRRMLGLHTANVHTYYTTVDPIPFTVGAVAHGERTDWSDRTRDLADPVEAHWAVVNLWIGDRVNANE